MLQICKNIYLQPVRMLQKIRRLTNRKQENTIKKRERSDDTNVLRTVHIVFNVCEEEETRTPTSQLTLPPQSSASTNSATSPVRLFITTLCGQGRIRTAEAAKQQIYSLPVLTTYLPTLKDVIWHFSVTRKVLVLQMRVQRYNFFCNLQTF